MDTPMPISEAFNPCNFGQRKLFVSHTQRDFGLFTLHRQKGWVEDFRDVRRIYPHGTPPFELVLLRPVERTGFSWFNFNVSWGQWEMMPTDLGNVMFHGYYQGRSFQTEPLNDQDATRVFVKYLKEIEHVGQTLVGALRARGISSP